MILVHYSLQSIAENLPGTDYPRDLSIKARLLGNFKGTIKKQPCSCVVVFNIAFQLPGRGIDCTESFFHLLTHSNCTTGTNGCSSRYCLFTSSN